MYRPNLNSVVLPVPEIIATEVLGGSCGPRILGKRSPQGFGMVPLERALVTFYSSSIVTFYRAMHSSAKRGIEIACRPSVCPSATVMLVDQYHIGWK